MYWSNRAYTTEATLTFPAAPFAITKLNAVPSRINMGEGLLVFPFIRKATKTAKSTQQSGSYYRWPPNNLWEAKKSTKKHTTAGIR